MAIVVQSSSSLQTKNANEFKLIKGNIMKAVLTIIIILLTFSSHAQRIKDLTDVAGVRSNQLIGYGLVVGLPGTGEQSPFTEQSFKTMLSNFGITMPENLKPKIKNVAAVAVHADLTAFAKAGQNIDVTVSSMGSAQSLRGGTLLQTMLMGLDGNTYAVAQGSLVVSVLMALKSLLIPPQWDVLPMAQRLNVRSNLLFQWVTI